MSAKVASFLLQSHDDYASEREKNAKSLLLTTRIVALREWMAINCEIICELRFPLAGRQGEQSAGEQSGGAQRESSSSLRTVHLIDCYLWPAFRHSGQAASGVSERPELATEWIARNATRVAATKARFECNSTRNRHVRLMAMQMASRLRNGQPSGGRKLPLMGA